MPINSFSTSHWLTEFPGRALKNQTHNHKLVFDWREKFVIGSQLKVLYLQKDTFSSSMPMRQSKHDLKDSPAFPIPGIFMQLNVISDHQSLKKHLFVRSGQTKLVENIPFCFICIL